MQWTVRLEARTSAGEVTATELATFSRPGVVSTLAEVGLVLAETKMLLAKLQALYLHALLLLSADRCCRKKTSANADLCALLSPFNSMPYL